MTTDRFVRTLLGIIAAIAILATVSISRVVIAPVVCALFIIAIVWPMQSRLQRLLPKLLALAIVVAITAAAFLVFASLATWGFGRIARALIADAARFQAIYLQAAEWLETHGIVVAALWAEHFNVGWLLRAMQEITTRLNTTVTF